MEGRTGLYALSLLSAILLPSIIRIGLDGEWYRVTVSCVVALDS